MRRCTAVGTASTRGEEKGRCRTPWNSLGRSSLPTTIDSEVTQHLRGNAAKDHVIGKRPAHDRTGRDGGVSPEHRARQDDDVGSEPTTRSDSNRGLGRCLPTHRLIGILVGVVLVGYVHVRSRLDLVAEFNRPVSDDVRTAPDDALATNGRDGRAQHLLFGADASGETDVGTDHRLVAYGEKALVVDHALRCEERRPRAEIEERGGVRVFGAYGGDLVQVAASGADASSEETSET